MKLIKNEIRPVGYCTLELSETEVQTIIGVFQENCYLKRVSFEEMQGRREEIYNMLNKIIKT